MANKTVTLDYDQWLALVVQYGQLQGTVQALIDNGEFPKSTKATVAQILDSAAKLMDNTLDSRSLNIDEAPTPPSGQ